MDDVLILEALQTGVTAAVAASDAPDLPVKYVGRHWQPPADQKWLELVFIPNNRKGDFWGNEKNYRGLFRLVLHWPNADVGAYPPMIVLASIARYFTKGLMLQSVQIYEIPDFAGVLENGQELIMVATLSYQSFQP
jgi:hypothetical protein